MCDFEFMEHDLAGFLCEAVNKSMGMYLLSYTELRQYVLKRCYWSKTLLLGFIRN